VKLETKCEQEIAKWAALEDPADVDDAVNKWVPSDEPQRSETLRILANLLSVEVSDQPDELFANVVMGASLALVQRENDIGRTSMAPSRKITMDDTHELVKVVLVGDSGVGKSSLLLRFVRDEFVTSTKATVGMDFCSRQLKIDAALTAGQDMVVQNLTVQVWDTAGQEQFRSLSTTYYRKGDGIMIVYDSSNRASFDNIPGWVQSVRDNAAESVLIMLVAAKCEGEPPVSVAEGKALAAEHKLMFATTSAMQGQGVIPAFKALCEGIILASENREQLKARARPRRAPCSPAEQINGGDDDLIPPG
jgi:small GTP-binding protein